MSEVKRSVKRKMLVVLTGPMAAGKGALEDWAQERNIPFVTMSELIEDHAGNQKENIGREGMQDFANTQRRAHGADVYARKAAECIERSEGSLVIVDGMRNMRECEYFRAHYPTLVIGIVPESPDQHYENVKERGRPGDPEDRGEFEQLRQRELGHGEGEEGQHVAACLDTADAVIINQGGEEDRDELIQRFEAILSQRGIEVH